MIPGGGLSTVPVPGAFLPPDDQLPATIPNPDPAGPTVPTDWELGGIALNDPSQGLQVQVWTFYLDGETIMVKPANGPAVAFYVAGPGVTELSGSFDSNMNPILAFVANGTAWLWWWNSLVSGYQLSSLPAMTSPRLTLDDKRATQDAARSVLLFYLREGQVCYRQSGERYQVEYQLYPVPVGFVALSRVGMADNRRVQIELRSDWIPPGPGPGPGPGPCVGVPVDATGCNNADWCVQRPPVPVWPIEPCEAPAWSLPPPCTPVDWAPVPPWEPTVACDHPPVSIPLNQFTYIAINGETQVLTPGAVQLVAHTTGVLPIDRGGTGAVSAEAARINLGLGTAATADASAFATAAQGALATTALQPGDDAASLGSGAAIPAGYGLLADGTGGADWSLVPVTIAADTTYYIAVTGNDTTGDGSLATPWLTLARAFAYLTGKEIAVGVSVTISIGAGDHLWTGPLTFAHFNGGQVFIEGAVPTDAITGVVQADFAAPLAPVAGVRGAFDLYNSAGALATTADAAARTAARAVDAPLNLALLRSVYPTRIAPATGTFTLNVASPLGGLKDILFVNGSLTALPGSAIDIGSSLAFSSLSSGVAVSVVANGSLSAQRLIIANCPSGIDVRTGRLAVMSAFVQGSTGVSVSAIMAGTLELAELVCSGGGHDGLSGQLGAKIFVVSTSGIKKEISLTGNGARGLYLGGGGTFFWNIAGGASGNSMQLRGNTLHQCLAISGCSFSIAPTTTVLSVQGGTTQPAMTVSMNTKLDSSGPVNINAGTNAFESGYGCTISFTGPVTITDSASPVLVRPLSASGSVIYLGGTLSLPATLGTQGVRAINGGRIFELGSVLLGLNATVPSKFSPPLGQLSTQGSLISSGPATSAALTMLTTAVTMSGSSVKLAALAGTGTRNLQVMADGTLVAVAAAQMPAPPPEIPTQPIYIPDD